MDELSNVGAYLPLRIRKGSDFGPFPGLVENPDGSRADLTGWVLKGQIRKRASDPQVVASFALQVTNPTEGEFSISLPASRTVNVVAGNFPDSSLSAYVYDIVLVKGEQVIPFIQGECQIFRWVTHGD